MLHLVMAFHRADDVLNDAVTVRSVLIYVAAKAASFREFARVLRPGGRLSIFEPINRWSGRPYFLKDLREGDWRTVISLSLGALVCGLFWETWNYFSFPKWIYHIPGLAFLHVFEMPLLGYGGYIPFALELYALKNFLWPNGPRLESRR